MTFSFNFGGYKNLGLVDVDTMCFQQQNHEPFFKNCGGQNSMVTHYQTELITLDISWGTLFKKKVVDIQSVVNMMMGALFVFPFFQKERDRKRVSMILSSHALTTCCTKLSFLI